MTVEQLANAITYLGGVLGAIVAGGAIINWTVLRPAKRFIRCEVLAAIEGIRTELARIATRGEETAAALRQHLDDGHP